MLRLRQHLRYPIWHSTFDFNFLKAHRVFTINKPSETLLRLLKQTQRTNTLLSRGYPKPNMSDTDKFCERGKIGNESVNIPKTTLQTDTENSPGQAESSRKIEEQPLPKLTPAEFKAYNRLAVVMDQYHNHFRSTWTELITGLKTSRPKNQTLRQFLSIAQGFCRMLSTHHDIEESYFFPLLAKKSIYLVRRINIVLTDIDV
ncbi:hypothetical protein TWF694_009921 [Orbilia ellipsospora]|uniref:Hemerythrin-like domain-containing protein n=1 Tax=Orbilia ellipsospora TaxID=2528407 RepID=A0AAV9XDQ3_9PEZI